MPNEEQLLALWQLVGHLNAGVYRNQPGMNGRFVYFNVAVESITGYSHDRLINMTMGDLYHHPSARVEFEREIQATGIVSGKQLHLKHRNGKSIYVEVTAKACFNELKEIEYYDGIVVDVTDKVEAEASISHQLKTPLLGIQSGAKRLLNEKSVLVNREIILKSIIGSSNIALLLANNLRYMSYILGIPSVKFSERLVEQQIADLVFALVIDLQQYALEKNIKIQIDSESVNSLPALLVDNTALSMVLFCVLDNAIKYSYNNTQIMVFSSTSRSYHSLHISNEGIPIDSTCLPPCEPNVFTKGFRTKDAEVFIPDGSGLGLYFVLEIMRKHGGRAIIEPSKQYKSTVRLLFPQG